MRVVRELSSENKFTSMYKKLFIVCSIVLICAGCNKNTALVQVEKTVPVEQNSQSAQDTVLNQDNGQQNQLPQRYYYKSNFIEAGNESYSWKLYASIDGKKKLIFSHSGGFEGAGGQFATTTLPYISLATFGQGDGGGRSNQLIFTNLIDGNYINVEEGNGVNQIRIQRNGKEYKSFSVYINDNCGVGINRKSGEILAAITGLGQYNIYAHDKMSIPKGYREELYYAFTDPKYLTCHNDRELGYTGFNEPYSLHLMGYSDDFTRLYFKAFGAEAGGKDWNEFFEYNLLAGTFSPSPPIQKSFKLVYEK